MQVLAETQKDSENVKKAWKAFLSKDWKTLENLTSNNAYIRVQTPAEIPFVGRYMGSSCFHKFYERFSQSLTIRSVPEVRVS